MPSLNPIPQSSSTNQVGTQIQVNENLEASEETKYAIRNVSQAISVIKSLVDDSEDIIHNSTQITRQINGAPPRSKSQLASLGRNWFPNINTGFLRNEVERIIERFTAPILNAEYLTAVELPAGWPNGEKKAATFRDLTTKTIRQWSQWPWFVHQLCREFGTFGFGYAVYFDNDEWRPTFIRQDAGFIPAGTQILDDYPVLFAVRWDYRVDQLIELVKDAEDRGVTGWDMENVANAINSAAPKSTDSGEPNERNFEEMVRQATIGNTYEKAYNLIQTYHLFSVDPDGRVSHHVVLADRKGSKDADPDLSGAQLFERRGEFETMADVVQPFVFNLDDGTVHGSWGAGQILFDISLEYEKTYMDWIAANKMIAKLKTMLKDGVNPDEVQLVVNDHYMLLDGAIFAGNTAAFVTDPKPFQELLMSLGASAREKIGNFIPPIPIKQSDIKAAHIQAKVQEQNERREQVLQRALMQWSRLVRMITRRLVKSSDDDAEKLQTEMERSLSEEEVGLLADAAPIRTIMDYTPYAAAKKAAFAQQKQGNPFYNQKHLERSQAEAAGGRAFADYVLIPGDDITIEKHARRQQALETAAMKAGTIIEVLPEDADWFHMQELRPELEQVVMQGAMPVAENMLKHYGAHYLGAVAKKGMPKGVSGNDEKSFIDWVGDAIAEGIPPQEPYQSRQDAVSKIEQELAQGPALTGPSQIPEFDGEPEESSTVEAMLEET